MYHWYLLTKEIIRRDEYLLINDPYNDSRKMPPAIGSTRRRWWLLGLMEALPLIAGLMASTKHQLFFKYDYLVAGVMITAILIVILRHRSPDPPMQHHS